MLPDWYMPTRQLQREAENLQRCLNDGAGLHIDCKRKNAILDSIERSRDKIKILNISQGFLN